MSDDSEGESIVDEKITTITVGFMALFVLIVLFSSFSGSDKSASTVEDDLAAIEADAMGAAGIASPQVEAASNWQYSERKDKIRNQSVYNAVVRSKNMVNFASPYDGGSTLAIVVREHPEWGSDVIFQIDRGQMICRAYDGCSGMISFDGEAEKLTLNMPADYSSTELFARY